MAKQQEAEAVQQRDAAEYSQYVSNMRFAQHERTQGSAYSFLQLLNAHLPESGRRGLRGWEWYYFFSQGHSERLTLSLQRVRRHAGVRSGESAIAWSADGQCLAVADQLGLVNIWDVFSGERKASLKGCSGWINSICWSPDAEKVAVGNDRRTVTFWDVATSEKLQTLHGHTAEVRCVDWSPDGVRFASGADDGTVLVWDLKTGETLLSLVGSRDPVVSLGWHPDGRQLLASYGATGHGELKIWDTASGDELFGWPTGYHHHATFSPDGSRVVWGAIKITDLKTGKVVASFPQSNGIHSSTWSPSGNRLATPLNGGAIKIWDTATGMEFSSIPAYAPVAKWSPQGTLLAGATYDGRVRVWDTATVGETVTLRTPGRRALSVAFSPDGHCILAGTPLGF